MIVGYGQVRRRQGRLGLVLGPLLSSLQNIERLKITLLLLVCFSISRACAHLFFHHVFHAGMHFSNTPPVEFRRLVAVSDKQHTCTRCSCLAVCAIYVCYTRARLGVAFLRVIYWVENLHFSLY